MRSFDALPLLRWLADAACLGRPPSIVASDLKRPCRKLHQLDGRDPFVSQNGAPEPFLISLLTHPPARSLHKALHLEIGTR